MRSTVLVLVAAGVAWSAVAFGDPLDKPAFAATPAELLAAAKHAPAGTAGDDVTVLRLDEEFRFDDHSRVTEHWRMVALVRTKEGADDWSSLGYEFRPSFQDHPQVRARVISPDGSSTELDPKQLRDEPAVTNADKQNGTIPLPRLLVGSVIEEEVVMVDREPMSAVGASTSTRLADSVATRLAVVAPVALKVRPVLHGLAAIRPTHTTSGAIETWRYTIGELKAPVGERNLPSDFDDSPRLAMTSIASWPVLAKELAARVDAQIAAAPIPLAPELPRTPTVETARAILTWLQSRVETEHISLTEAALVAKSPAESLKLGRADDLSMAVAYVALLRKAGIAANVALISSGPGRDLSADMTAVDALDRAVVRARLDSRDVWIDASSDALALLTMPSSYRHRHALVLDAATTSFADTPAIVPSDNLFRDVRTYELAESGRARITEVRRFGGVWDVGARTQERDDPKRFEKDRVRDSKSRFAVDSVDRMTTTKPTAPEIPFEVTSVMTSPRGFTTRKEAQVWLYPFDVTWALPDAFMNADAPARTHDYQWGTPHIYEIEARIVVPDGYAMPAIADRSRDLGTIKLTETQRIAGNVLTVTMRLDTGKLRITAAELEATRKALAGIADENVHLVFPSIAHQAFEKGAWKDAIREANRVISAHPKDGKHHAALAELLVQMGLGDAGRREARLAVQLEPNDADNHLILGWALEHDLFGRAFAPGHDHAGARAELEKARKLNPKHEGVAIELGNLLAYDERGNAWASGSDPKGSAVARRAANELAPSATHAVELTRALLWSGDYAGAAQVMKAAKPSDERNALLVVAVVLQSGPPAGLREADGLGSSDARKQAVTTAGSILFVLRHYPEARTLFAEVGTFGPSTPQGTMFAKLARVDHPLDVKTPGGAAIEAEVSVLTGKEPQGFWDAKTGEEASYEIKRTLAKVTQTAALTHEMMADISRSIPTMKIDGDKRAWRIEITSVAMTEVVYAAEDHGTIKVIGMPSAPFGVGRHALRLLANNDVETAKRLLDWIITDAKRPPLLEVVWGPNHATDRDAVSLAAAVLSGPTDPTHALPIVEKCSAAPLKGDVVCLVIMDEINNARDARDDTIARLTTYLATHAKDPAASRLLAYALAEEGRASEAEALVADVTAPFDHDIDELKVQIALARHDLPAAMKLFDAIGKANESNIEALNELAWLEVTANTNLSEALVSVTESVRRGANAANLHTKATVEVELGDLRAAVEDLQKAIDHHLRKEPAPSDYYVQGRIAELIGLPDEAIAAYRKAKPPGPPHRSLVPDTPELAQKRLAALGKP